MTWSRRPPPEGDYEVGYGKPPRHTRFRKGWSGNPRGRPRGDPASRLLKILQQEAFRLVTVREGDAVIRLPAIQAVLRSQIAQAAKGNGPAGRTLLQALMATQGAQDEEHRGPEVDPPPLNNGKAALALLSLLHDALKETDQSK